MHLVRIEWLSKNEGGRKTPPPSAGRYFSVARFPEDINWQNNAWSVVFEIESTVKSDGKDNEYISGGCVSFLMDTAPKERMETNEYFDIYEGPKKVARVFLLS
ncbi:hypothetical protein TI10_08580 [Photorhabdus luminescens subsp. luminescens]|uniref:Uncharacterized protein n=2 Tax=Photorhabdus TaxID=29487 RepID=A0A1G5RAS4_PHOLU|nr:MULTISPECIES: hypothetical protein [Photorhabdus]KMW73161.1 hypothetical protein TI10_08580 [Photorhabdus luminescens subsp. luminescens]TDB58203.1 hypothetical protein C5467_10580 [Photorhabdus khanii subsp. guanajuatensis]SCZ71167.1 hypothetical protein SAMN02982990_03673 [Photorhabdus luminescens]